MGYAKASTFIFILLFTLHSSLYTEATAQEPASADEQQIEEVVVTARGRNRARKYFRRFVRKVPLQGWYVGLKGGYVIDVDGELGWRSAGTYERNHIPGDDANRHQIELFKLRPGVAADSVYAWQAQRHILLASSIAERAAVLGHQSDAVMSYRGLEDGEHLFLVAEPAGSDRRRGFSTRVMVSEETGLIVRSESVSASPGGVWSVAVDYLLFEDLLYPSRVSARFEHLNPISGEDETVLVEMLDITPRRFDREVAPDPTRNDPSKVLKKKVRKRLLSY